MLNVALIPKIPELIPELSPKVNYNSYTRDQMVTEDKEMVKLFTDDFIIIF